MATGFAPGVANSILNSIFRATAWTPPAAAYVQLHIGDPGAAGTSNPASNTTRQQATFGSAASAGAIANTVAVTWTSVPASEDYTHFSVWSASSSGTFQCSGTITANPVVTGDTLTYAIGAFTVSIPVAS
jgi:hypothetical protein